MPLNRFNIHRRLNVLEFFKNKRKISYLVSCNIINLNIFEYIRIIIMSKQSFYCTDIFSFSICISKQHGCSS